MTDLSPAAQQVFWEFNRVASGKPDDWHYLPAIAAALRAAADQVVPQRRKPMDADNWEEATWIAQQDTREKLLTIATELEGQ